MLAIIMKEVKWDVFILSDVFKITSTKNGIDKNKLINIDSNIYPYITRSDNNNGINSFIGIQELGLNEGNVIIIGLDTQTVFYQPHAFYTGQNIQILSNHLLNKNNALFIITLLKKLLDKFNWGGNGATLTRLNKSRILLPITDNGEPNFDFMEEYISNKINIKTKYIKNALNSKFDKLTYKPLPNLNEIKWAEFTLDSLGTIKSGKDITKKEMVFGKTPYVSSTANNNGISAYIDNDNKTLESNCISINRNGSVGYAFYHPYSALFSNDCRKLTTEHNTNKYISLFIVNQIKAQKDKYNYGYKMGTHRLKKQKIMLPINANGNPDYEYMEQYMINFEINLLTKYKKYIENI